MPIDELMATCPLKHHIREHLWESYARKLNKQNITYLTLYSPPLMDVKHFTNRGLILFDNKESKYKNVVAITNDPKHGFSDTVSGGAGRPDLLREGLIHQLIQGRDTELLNKFPFDVINLDYCNHIYGPYETSYLSENLEDTQAVIEQQRKKGSQEFVLFVTTRTDSNNPQQKGFPKGFITLLTQFINLNIQANETFRVSYKQTFGDTKPKSLIHSDFENFISLGILKFLSMELAANRYTIIDSDATWLHRNEKGRPYSLDLLHLALHIREGEQIQVRTQKKQLQSVGSLQVLEQGVTSILDKIGGNGIGYLATRRDNTKFQQQYGDYIKSLRENTFEIPTPKPL